MSQSRELIDSPATKGAVIIAKKVAQMTNSGLRLIYEPAFMLTIDKDDDFRSDLKTATGFQVIRLFLTSMVALGKGVDSFGKKRTERCQYLFCCFTRAHPCWRG